MLFGLWRRWSWPLKGTHTRISYKPVNLFCSQASVSVSSMTSLRLPVCAYDWCSICVHVTWSQINIFSWIYELWGCCCLNGCIGRMPFTTSISSSQSFTLTPSILRNQMADAIRGFWHQIVTTKRLYLNPHEHFGRANICRAALASYVGIYFLFKWNQKRKVGGLYRFLKTFPKL